MHQRYNLENGITCKDRNNSLVATRDQKKTSVKPIASLLCSESKKNNCAILKILASFLI